MAHQECIFFKKERHNRGDKSGEQEGQKKSSQNKGGKVQGQGDRRERLEQGRGVGQRVQKKEKVGEKEPTTRRQVAK